MGAPPRSMVQPVRAAAGMGTARRFMRTTPTAQDQAAPSIRAAPRGHGGDAGSALRQEQGHPGYAQSQGHQTAAGEGFAEPAYREQHAPHRHRVAEQGRPSRGQKGTP